MSRMPTGARGRRSRFFDSEGVDELLSMVLELTAEVSVLRERQYVTERVLEEYARRSGGESLDLAAAIEAWRPTDSDVQRLGAERERLLATVLRSTEADTDRAPDADADTETLAHAHRVTPGDPPGTPDGRADARTRSERSSRVT